MMKLEDQRAATQKKIPKKAKKIDGNTLSDRERDGFQQEKPDSFADIEITEKDRQRSSEIGISQKHRRLQASDLQKIF